MASAVENLIRGAITPVLMKVADFNRARMKTSQKKHVFLDGINAPMDAELTIESPKVTGEIPKELAGRYLRIGPNPVNPPHEQSYHWFLGDGMVHGVSLKAGKALWYRNRYIRSNAVSEALGEPPAPGVRSELSDTVNTNILGHAGETWALVEAGGFPVRLDEELNTIAHDPFGGTLKNSFSAHPHLDPLTGEMHAICYKGPVADTVHHVVVDAQGKVRREEPITVQDGPMIHDCMITKNYVIILDLPVTFSMKTLLGGHEFPYRWNPAHQARVGLLPKDGTNDDVIWCNVSPCFAFHPCNAFENEDGSVTLDLCVHDSMFTDSTKGPDSTATSFERWTINPAKKSVDRKILDPDPQEFPRLNETLLGQPYRYAYTMALPGGFDDAYPDSSCIYKHDLNADERQVHDFGKGNVPGEFIFVPKQDGSKEDDGWMMGFVVNMADETSQLVILDAAEFEGEPQATVHIPHRIPSGFHGNWVPG